MSVGGFADPGELTAAGLACRRGERLIFSALDCAVAAGGALFLTGPNGSGKSSLLRLLATLLPPQAGGIAWGGRPVADDLPGHRARLVFRGVSCALPPGGALVLTGANGSGKSSLLRLLATLLTPAAGGLLWAGAPIVADLPRYRANLRYVGHLDAIKPALAVRETLAFWAETRAAARPAIDAALAAFALEPLADWPCRWLSAGQRRRLALARLIAAPAPLWLLDEPSTALDGDAEARLVAAIAAHRAAGGRVVVATHQPLDVPRAQTLSLAAFAPDPGAAVDDALARF